MVAGEAQDLKVVAVGGAEVLVELLEAGVLGREAALGGGVDNEDDLALELAEVELVAGLCTRGLACERETK